MIYFSKSNSFIAIVILLIGIVSFSFALDNENNLSTDKIIESDFYKVAQNIQIKGLIKGDFIGASQSMKVDGIIEGDMILASQTITSTADIKGDIRTACQILNLNGTISKNITSFAQKLVFGDNTEVYGNTIVFCEEATIEGKFNKNVTVYANKVNLNAEVLGDLEINVGNEGTLNILPKAKIKGHFNYKGNNKVNNYSGDSKIDINWNKVDKKGNIYKNNKVETFLGVVFDFIQKIIYIAFYFLLGALTLRYLPKLFIHDKDKLMKRNALMGLKGFIVLLSFCGVVVGAVILFLADFIVPSSFTIVTLIFITSIYMCMIYLSTIPVIFVLGNLIFKNKFNKYLRFGFTLLMIELILYAIKALGEYNHIFNGLELIIKTCILLIGIGYIFTSAKILFRVITDNKVTNI